MQSLFGDNIFFIYFLGCLTILNYSSFKENQKILLLYIISYGLCFLDVLGCKNTLILLLMLLFIFSQYLTDDTKKLQIITKFRYKVLDYIYHLVFQYEGILVIISIFMNGYTVEQIMGNYFKVIKIISLLIFIFAIHKLSSQKFKVKRISEIMENFETHPIYNFPYDKDDASIYNLLTTIEDKTYFIRKNTYNFISIEFICYKLKRFRDTYLRERKIPEAMSVATGYIKKSKNIRGYSTIEMQLIRNIGIERGYKCVIRRKIYEFIYTKIFFSSLRDYYKLNSYIKYNKFKHYLIYIYYNTVDTKIGNKKIRPLSNIFENKNIDRWSLDTLFIACVGLSHRRLDANNIKLYTDVLKKFNLNQDEILYRAEYIKNNELSLSEIKSFLNDYHNTYELKKRKNIG